MRLERGLVVRDTYTIDKLLGSGCFADVYLVRHRFLGMQAMKVFREPTLGSGDDALREAFLLSRFGHPHVVRVFEANVLDETYGGNEFLTMEYVAGPTLHEYASEHTLSIRRVLEIACQVCEAAACAHAHEPPIVHRDIKPHNVLVEPGDGTPHVKLADFGFALSVRRGAITGSAAGTLAYMAPETLDGTATTASDVWSLGILTYELLTGLLPYPKAVMAGATTEADIIAALRKAHAAAPRPPSFLRPDVSTELDALVERALATDPAARYPDAGALLDALRDYRRRTGGAPRR